jgi:hypothetical protein
MSRDQRSAPFFSRDYATARARFLEQTRRRGFALESHPIDARGPLGEKLAIDVARAGVEQPRAVLVVSSGLHGVEGPFGAAVQLALLEPEDAAGGLPEGVALVLVHALNPYGFAWVRRANEDNVDLNRNFLAAGQPYEGSPPGYAALDSLLNPRHAPGRLDGAFFRVQGIAAILRQGMPAMKQAVAGGQYEYPRGLFFGGERPSRTYQILSEHLPHWIGQAERVVHLDFHTGLGPWATYQLLVDRGIAPSQFEWLRARLGDRVQHSDPDGSIAFQVRGDLGSWCRTTFPDRLYELLCAEFGTYPPLRTLAALRAENQVRFWGRPDARTTLRAKARLSETFVPASPRWRLRALGQALEIFRRGLDACGRD